VKAHRKLDRLAGRARGRDDDDAAGRRLRLHEGFMTGRKPVAILDRARHGRGRCKEGAQMRSPLDSRRAGFVVMRVLSLKVGAPAAEAVA
jgi:hypothetical protein